MNSTKDQLSQLAGPRLIARLMKRFSLVPSDLPYHDLGHDSTPISDGKQFSSYDYLGLRLDSRVLNAATKALKEHGLSTSASRVVSGELGCHHSLESKLAGVYNQESALVFVSGHATNVSTVAALVEAKDLVLIDQLSHNSIQMGAQLSGAQLLRYRHNDTEHLEKLLCQFRPKSRRCLVVSEGHFSMDGDFPDLSQLCALKDRYECMLMVDEAHALGVLGRTGLGSHEEQGIDPKQVDIWMGTLSKSLGSTGGYIAAKQSIINHLRLFAPGFTYSVGLNAPCCAAAEAALDILLSSESYALKLQSNSTYLHSLLLKKGFNLGSSKGSAIIPIILDPKTTMQAAKKLLASGWGVYPLAPPSVPATSFRLRIFVRATHSQSDLDELVEAIIKATS